MLLTSSVVSGVRAFLQGGQIVCWLCWKSGGGLPLMEFASYVLHFLLIQCPVVWGLAKVEGSVCSTRRENFVNDIIGAFWLRTELSQDVINHYLTCTFIWQWQGLQCWTVGGNCLSFSIHCARRICQHSRFGVALFGGRVLAGDGFEVDVMCLYLKEAMSNLCF